MRSGAAGGGLDEDVWEGGGEGAGESGRVAERRREREGARH